jgi:hypothetical protein
MRQALDSVLWYWTGLPWLGIKFPGNERQCYAILDIWLPWHREKYPGYGTLRHSVMIYLKQLPKHGAKYKYPLCHVILDTVASTWDKVPYTSNYCKCHVLLDTIAMTWDQAPWVCNMQCHVMLDIVGWTRDRVYPGHGTQWHVLSVTVSLTKDKVSYAWNMESWYIGHCVPCPGMLDTVV